MNPPPQAVLDFVQFGCHPLAYDLAQDTESSIPRLATDVREAEKIESLWLTLSSLRSVLLCIPSKLDQSGLFGMQLQSEQTKATP